jgi:hypothetical protein
VFVPSRKPARLIAIRSVQPKADTLFRPSVLPDKVSKNDNQKGTTGFRGETVHDAQPQKLAALQTCSAT